MFTRPTTISTILSILEDEVKTYSKRTNNKTGDSISIPIPGLTKNDIDIHVDNNLLIVSYEKKDELKYLNSFTKTYYLYDDVDINNIDAKVENGLLEITLNKKEKKEKKTITIK